MATKALQHDNFATTVTGSGTVLVDFWAGWCGPCRMFAPVFERASERYPGVVFAKVDTESEPELAESFGIRSIPTLLAFRDGILLYSQPGALPERSLDELIEAIGALDMEDIRRQLAEQTGEGPSDS